MCSKSIHPPLLLLSVALLLAVVLSQAAAQVTGATLSGTVTDPSGSVIPHATVTVTNVSQGTERASTTNKDGDYTLPNVTPGVYRLRVAHGALSRQQLARTVKELEADKSIVSFAAPSE